MKGPVDTPQQTKKIAFALGGLGGSNAHGAGFLAAARDLDVKPDIITCTSGQIVWTYAYLKDKGALKQTFRDKIAGEAAMPAKVGWINWVSAFTGGIEGILKPATEDYVRRWLPPWNPLDADQWLNRVMPAKWFEPERGEADYQQIADCFNNEAEIGIAFNVYHPTQGISYLHMNKAALSFLDKQDGGCNASETVLYRPITWQSVRDALWLYLYGFEEGRERVDGAYHRQIIISELHHADVIFAVKPQAQRWIGQMPQNFLEIQDFEVEMWFNSSYASQVAGLQQINKLVEQGCFAGGPCESKFHRIDLVPVEVEKQYKFHDYFVEYPEVFDLGYQKGTERLTVKLGL